MTYIGKVGEPSDVDRTPAFHEMAEDEHRRPGAREIHGIVFGAMGKPTSVLVPGYSDPDPRNFAAWLDDLRAAGWEVTLTPALSFEGVLVDARHTR